MDFVKEVEYYCEQENTSGALLVNGNWGSGKTYFFEKILPQLPWFYSNASIISISLFGITSREILDKKLKEKYILKNLSIPEISTVKKGIISNIIYAITKFFTGTDIKLTEKEISLKSLLGAAQVFTGSWDSLVQIPPRDKLGKVILVFDDLERCPMKMEELLGAINAYVEGSEIKTILIANEDYIKEKEKTDKTYTTMKEKLVCRTVRYEPDSTVIVRSIIDNHRTNDQNYTLFLKSQKDALEQFLKNHKNIRTLKSTIQDFERFYKIIASEEIDKKYYHEILSHYLSITTVYTRNGSDEKQTKDHSEALLNTISLNYDAMKLWKEKGIWDETMFQNQLSLYKHNTPARILLREENILNLDDETFKNAVTELDQLISDNQFELQDYSHIFRLLLCGIEYRIPLNLNIEGMKSAIEHQIQEIKSGNITYFLPFSYLLKPDERTLLAQTYPGIETVIELLEDSGKNLSQLNQRAQLINALRTNNQYIIKNNIHTCCGTFDTDFADAVYRYWSTLKHSRYTFIQEFMLSFLHTEEFKDTYKETIKGIDHLISLLSSNSDSDGPISMAQKEEFKNRLLEKRRLLEEKFVVNPKEQTND